MTRRVVVTGAGVVSPLGATPAELHAALVAGRSALRPPTRVEGGADACPLAGELHFDPQTALSAERNLRPLDRVSQITAAAAGRALEASGWDAARRETHEVGLVLGTMFCGVHTIAEFDRRGLTRGPSYVSPLEFANTVINAAAGQTAIWHDLTGLNSTISAGAASSLQAVAHAADLIRAGRAEALLAGGVEELSRETLFGFARAGLLCGTGGDAGAPCPVPFDARRNGFALGEGAALVMLEEREAARARGAHVLCEVQGGASTYDPSRGADHAQSARALARAAQLALSDAGVAPEDVDALSASASGSPAWDRAESCALAGVFGARAGALPVTALKALLGEMLGATGAFQVVDLIETLRDGVLPGVAGLETLDPAVRLSPRADSRELPVERALLTAGLDGACCALVIARAP
jgi:3-oxoacyl-(acyl-carrier-protein) synthase